MQDWIKISLCLCTFGFFREMRPSEPFVTEFLSGEWRNVTAEQVNRDVYPWGTYSYLAQLVLVFLVTDILRYKPIIIASAIVGIILWCLLLWTTTLEGLQLVQVCYGFFMAAEVAYYTYMYAKVSKDKYQKVTGHARAGILTGRFLASVLAQLLVSLKLMDYRELNYLSLAAQCASLVFAILLPSVGISLYFYSNVKTDDNQSPTHVANSTEKPVIPNQEKPEFSWNRAMNLLWDHFCEAYRNPSILQWSFWWALAMAGFLQVQSYVQLLWQEIDPDRENIYNGAVEAALTLLGAISAFVAGLIDSTFFEKFNLWILTICSLLEGIFIVISSYANHVLLAYAMYILFGVLYTFMITMASAMVAKKLAEDSFALIFGINTLLALVFQSTLTFVIVSETFFKLTPKGQFLIFGLYFIGLAILFLVASIIQMILKLNKKEKPAKK